MKFLKNILNAFDCIAYINNSIISQEQNLHIQEYAQQDVLE